MNMLPTRRAAAFVSRPLRSAFSTSPAFKGWAGMHRAVVPLSRSTSSPRSIGTREFSMTRPKEPMTEAEEVDETKDTLHFRVSNSKHPLNAKVKDKEFNGHYHSVTNHVWTEQEIQNRMNTLYTHVPETYWDKAMNGMVYIAYHSFNALTGYKPENTPVRAVEWRLIVLESVAGVPPFVAAGFRHFRSLRTLQRDHGWIQTCLEEAENERMHLLVCLRMFNAGWVTRTLVIAAQTVVTPLIFTLYMIKPKACHRFVGYLEETACITYANIIRQCETPGTPLHEEWNHLKAPKIAINYWRLSPEASWVDTLKCMFADESNHRDVNHTFAVMPSDDPNPFIAKHQNNASKAWRMDQMGQFAKVGDEHKDGKVHENVHQVNHGAPF